MQKKALSWMLAELSKGRANEVYLIDGVYSSYVLCEPITRHFYRLHCYHCSNCTFL